jgi:hypothetical protein
MSSGRHFAAAPPAFAFCRAVVVGVGLLMIPIALATLVLLGALGAVARRRRPGGDPWGPLLLWLRLIALLPRLAHRLERRWLRPRR